MIDTNEARIETSTICNHRCVFCPHSTSFKRKKEVMSLKMFIKLLDKIKDEAPQIDRVTISGFGEAFLDSTILKKIEYAHNQGYKVHVLTNGTLLYEQTIDFMLELPIHGLRISLHSLNPEVWRLITGGDSKRHQRLLDHIEYIIENKKETNFVITVDVIDRNKEEIPAIIEKYSERVDLLEIWKPHNWVNTLKFREGTPTKKTCGRPFNSPLQVQVDGTVNMCCFDYNGKLLLGDLNSQTLEDIFNGRFYLELRKAHEDGILNTSKYICRYCDQRIEHIDAVIYNSKFVAEDRVGRTSTTYTNMITRKIITEDLNRVIITEDKD